MELPHKFSRSRKIASFFFGDGDEELPTIPLVSPPEFVAISSAAPPDRLPPLPGTTIIIEAEVVDNKVHSVPAQAFHPVLESSLQIEVQRSKQKPVVTEPDSRHRDNVINLETTISIKEGLETDDNWHCYRVFMPRRGWPTERGIINAMRVIKDDRTACEGTRLDWCIQQVRQFLRTKVDGNTRLEHKIGMCFCAKTRWEYYCDDDDENKWRPDIMVLIDRTSNRESVGFLEAGMIRFIKDDDDFAINSLNVTRRDRGGEGPRVRVRAHLPHYVYICIRLVK